MSRIGKMPIPVPSGVEVTINGSHVTVKGPKGTLEHDAPETITIAREGDELVVTRPDDERENRALHGLTRSLVANMVTGVSEGFVPRARDRRRRLPRRGQWPATARDPGRATRTRCTSTRPTGIEFEVPAPTRITVRGFDKQLVGQVAADIRKIRKPEPYKGKGIRYANELVQRKAGKSAK